MTTVRDHEANDDDMDMEYLFEGEEYADNSPDESNDAETVGKVKALDADVAESVQKIKAEQVEQETTIEEVIFETAEDEILDGSNGSNVEDTEQMEEVVMDAEVEYEEEHLLDDEYLEEQEQAFGTAQPAKKRVKKDYMTLHYCRRCNKDFSTKTNLLRHIQTHDGVKPYQCNICGAGFTQNGSLKQHVFIHTGEVSIFSLHSFCKKKKEKNVQTFRFHSGRTPATSATVDLLKVNRWSFT